MTTMIWVGLGAGSGATCRYGITVLGKLVSPTIPYATILINVIGSLLAGYLTGSQLPGTWALFLLTGVCGGFTTFSTFSVDTFVLVRNHRYLLAGWYWLGTVALGVLAVVCGLWLGVHS
ncbi:fluoride efflux transporter FluC [Fructilactobacillus sanfranciscensis]|uniref:fluoride efflux transporter FluC n=1 Tax=Fructilactobacillus sanfranciscensis TaxID=1625 RepID=UPI003757A38F